MAVLPHEGTFSILYGSHTVPVGATYRPGYLARPDEAGKFPVALIVPGLGGLGSAEKALARSLARNGVAALAVEVFGGADSESRLSGLQLHQRSRRGSCGRGSRRVPPE